MRKKNRHIFVIAHNIRSLYNVGSIFRTAEAFGADKVFLTGYTGTPENPIHAKKIGKVALGAEKWVAWERNKYPIRLIKKLQTEGVSVVGMENNVKAKKISDYKFKFPLALVLGEEVKGINKKILKLCDGVVEIPMYGKKQSLNVSVAFGVALYAISKIKHK